MYSYLSSYLSGITLVIYAILNLFAPALSTSILFRWTAHVNDLFSLLNIVVVNVVKDMHFVKMSHTYIH